MRTDGEVVELEIPARSEFLSLARLVVAATAELDPTLSRRRIEDLRLVVSEAVTNAIRAQQQRGREEQIVIRARYTPDRFEVTVRDHGGGFHPDELEPVPAVTDPARLEYEGGFGLSLITELADESDFRAVDEGTDVHLIVYLKRYPDLEAR